MTTFLVMMDVVQFYWTFLSQNKLDSDFSDILLKEVIKLWITIKGFSIAGYWQKFILMMDRFFNCLKCEK